MYVNVLLHIMLYNYHNILKMLLRVLLTVMLVKLLDQNVFGDILELDGLQVDRVFHYVLVYLFL